jgi:hypothetical protein
MMRSSSAQTKAIADAKKRLFWEVLSAFVEFPAEKLVVIFVGELKSLRAYYPRLT